MAAKTKTLGVRLTEELYDRIQAVAEKTNLPPGHLVTECLAAAIEIITKEPTDKEEEVTPRFLAITRLDYHWSTIESKDLKILIKK